MEEMSFTASHLLRSQTAPGLDRVRVPLARGEALPGGMMSLPLGWTVAPEKLAGSWLKEGTCKVVRAHNACIYTHIWHVIHTHT